jgi:hypothetical protein
VSDALRKAQRLAATLHWLRRNHGGRLVVAVTDPRAMGTPSCTAFAQDLTLLWQLDVRSVVVHDQRLADPAAALARSVDECGLPAVSLASPAVPAVGVLIDAGCLPVVSSAMADVTSAALRIADEIDAVRIVLMTAPDRTGLTVQACRRVTEIPAPGAGSPHALLTQLLMDEL